MQMVRSLRKESASGIHHVILRGVSRQEILHDDSDCRRFLDTVLKYKRNAGVQVYGWCLMRNHVHLLIREGEEEISATMKRIAVSYARYYNDKYEVSGHVFQDRFRSQPVETDGYLMRVTRYIHQNPVKAGFVVKPDDWQWSSCLGYYGRPVYPVGLLDKEFILALFGQDGRFSKERFIEFNEERRHDPGDQDCDNCIEDMDKRRGGISDSEARREIEAIIAPINVAQVKALPREQRNELLRKIKTVPGMGQRQAARILGVSPSIMFRA